jgi:hypothetical protein
MGNMASMDSWRRNSVANALRSSWARPGRGYGPQAANPVNRPPWNTSGAVSLRATRSTRPTSR